MVNPSQRLSLNFEPTAFDLLILESWVYERRPLRLLSTEETAEFVGLSLSSLRRGVDTHTFPIAPARPTRAPRFPWLLVARYAALGMPE